MKIKFTLFIFIVALTFLNCKNNNQENLTIKEELAKTPQVLEENYSDVAFSSFSKRWKDNIISKLYSEALEKDKKLNLLNERIKDFTNDSVIEKTKSFTKYSNINNRYWNEVDGRIYSIKDSLLKKETASLFKKLKLDYEKSIYNHNKLMNDINFQKENLRDQLTLMKLFVTQPMMKNYQVNEKPNIKELEELISQYKKLSEESKQYTEIKK